VTFCPQEPPTCPKCIPQFRWGMESMFWLLGPPACTGGPPQHRPGRPRACRSPASKTENIPRWVPSRYSCEDVGRRVPDLAAPFLVWAPIRIATYNLEPRSFDICAPTPSPEEKSGCKGKLQLQKVLCGLSSVSSFHRRRCDWMRCPIDEVCAFIAGQLFDSSRRTASGKPAG
jgi:hypothetical protein